MLPSAGVTFEQTHRKLQDICASRILLPPSHLLSNDAIVVDEYPFSSGGFSDVYKGRVDDLQVCVKKLRVASPSDSEQAEKEDT